MYSSAIVFTIFIFLSPSSVRSDMLMQSKTYNVRAVATNINGKSVQVNGSLIDFKLLIVNMEGQTKFDYNNVMFSITAKVPSNSKDNADMDYYQLNTFPIPSSSSGGASNSLPTNPADSASPPLEKQSSLPSTHTNVHPTLPLLKQNLSGITQLESTSKSTDQSIESVSTTGFDTAPAVLSNTRFNQIPPLPLLKNNSSQNFSCQQNNWPVGGALSQNSELNLAQLYPKSLNAISNASEPARTHSFDSVPSQTFKTSQSHNSAKGAFIPPQGKSSQNVFNPRNPENREQGGPRADEMPIDHLTNNPKMNVGYTQPRTTHVPANVQNVSLSPSNQTTSINLAPLKGISWSNWTKNGAAQTYANTPQLNLRLPLRNVSISTANSLTNNITSTTNHYASSDAVSLMQNLEPVNEKTAGSLVEQYLNNEPNNSASLADMQKIAEAVDEFLDKQAQMYEYNMIPLVKNATTGVPSQYASSTTPSMVDEVVEMVEDQPVIYVIPINESTTSAPTTLPPTKTTLACNKSTSETSIRPTNASTCTMNMETPSGTATGSMMTPSWLAVLLLSLPILVRTVVLH